MLPFSIKEVVNQSFMMYVLHNPFSYRYDDALCIESATYFYFILQIINSACIIEEVMKANENIQQILF